MEISDRLTADDYRHGLIAWRTLTAWRRWNYRLGVAIMGIAMITCAMLLIVDHHSETRQVAWIDLGVSAFWLVLIWSNPWLSARIQFRRMPSAQSPITIAVSESGLHVHSLHSDSQVAWSAYMGWGEESSVFVILPQPKIYVPIPKRAFTTEQVVEFREILHRNILPHNKK